MPTITDRCTCTPYWQDAGGGYTEYVPEWEPTCPVHGEVDAIMTAGRYVDRRGRVWRASPLIGWGLVGRSMSETLRSSRTLTQMRLMIERDQHRDVCPGLRDCDDHPVPHVMSYGGAAAWDVWGPGDWYVCSRPSLPEAFAAALKLVVDREVEPPTETVAGLDHDETNFPRPADV